MRLLFFPVNNAWAFVVGDNLRTARPTRLHGSPLFFEKRSDAVEAAKYCGLTVDKIGTVFTKPLSNPARRWSKKAKDRKARVRAIQHAASLQMECPACYQTGNEGHAKNCPLSPRKNPYGEGRPPFVATEIVGNNTPNFWVVMKRATPGAKRFNGEIVKRCKNQAEAVKLADALNALTPEQARHAVSEIRTHNNPGRKRWYCLICGGGVSFGSDRALRAHIRAAHIRR